MHSRRRLLLNVYHRCFAVPRGLHVIVLLTSLQEFKNELVHLAGDKGELLDQGRRLVRISSDVRAADIEHKMSQIEEKWQRLQNMTSERYEC